MVVPMDGDGVSCRVPRGALVVTMLKITLMSGGLATKDFGSHLLVLASFERSCVVLPLL
jgi:hypothetical protein